MFNPLLHAFVCTADCGSFTRAAEKLFISPTAVMKQVNALETHLGLRLLDRTPQGVRLTAAGEVIYRDAKFLFDYSRRSLESARPHGPALAGKRPPGHGGGQPRL